MCSERLKKRIYTNKQSKTAFIIIIIIIYPLTARVVGAPQMISQPFFSSFPCSPLPSGTCRTSGLSIPWCCFPTSSTVCLVFFPVSPCLARWFWPDHTTAVCVSLRWSGLRMILLLARSWHGLPCWVSVLLGFAKFFGWGYLSFVY